MSSQLRGWRGWMFGGLLCLMNDWKEKRTNHFRAEEITALKWGSKDRETDGERERCQRRTDSVLVIKERVDVSPSVVRKSKICKRQNKGGDIEREREKEDSARVCVSVHVSLWLCMCEPCWKPWGNLLYLLTWGRVNKADCSQHGTRVRAARSHSHIDTVTQGGREGDRFLIERGSDITDV